MRKGKKEIFGAERQLPRIEISPARVGEIWEGGRSSSSTRTEENVLEGFHPDVNEGKSLWHAREGGVAAGRPYPGNLSAKRGGRKKGGGLAGQRRRIPLIGNVSGSLDTETRGRPVASRSRVQPEEGNAQKERIMKNRVHLDQNNREI